MAFDSTADLLFRIGANSDDAESNIQRFRGILSKDLNTMGDEFQGWASKVFGSLNSAAGIATAGLATLGAGMVAAAAYATSAAEKYAAYADEIGRGVRVTGMQAEQMSVVRHAAEELGVNYDTLITGLTRFESTVVKAAAGSDQQAAAFTRLGISHKDLIAGQKDLWPLLEKVADAFHNTTSAVEKTAMARELFSRGGAELLAFLNAGSKGIEQFGEQARELGLILTQQDVVAAREFKMAIQELHEKQEAFDIYIGRTTMPLMEGWYVGLSALIETIKKGPQSLLGFSATFGAEMEKAYEEIQGLVRGAMSQGGKSLLPEPKELKSDFYEISNILESVRGKTAGVEGDTARVANEVSHWNLEIGKASEALSKMKAQGTITADAYAREMKALGSLPGAIYQYVQEETDEIRKKQNEEVQKTTLELQGYLQKYQQQTWDAQREGWDREIGQLRVKLSQEKTFVKEHWDLLAQIVHAGYVAISREQSAAYLQDLTELQQHLAQVVQQRMTTAERLQFVYEQEAAAYSDAKLQEKLADAQTEDEQLALMTQFQLNREALLQRYGNEMVALQNSLGWQGVFGDEFAQAIRGNEDLLREWSQSADQAFMMVRVAVESLNEMGQRAFANFAKGMGQNIASAIVYKKSIGEAMREAVASTLESIAAESITWAIYSTALGFVRLAQHDYAAAGSAFTAAAIWGSVGVAAAVAGRAIAPSQKTPGAAEAGSEGSRGGAAGTGASTAPESTRPLVQVNIQGHVIGPSGIEQLVDIINEQVQNRDVRLVATQVKSLQRTTP